METIQSHWHHRPAAGSGIPGAQVDLFIDRRDGTINFLTMVTTLGVTDNACSRELVTSSLTLDDPVPPGRIDAPDVGMEIRPKKTEEFFNPERTADHSIVVE